MVLPAIELAKTESPTPTPTSTIVERLTETTDLRLPWANWRTPSIVTTPLTIIEARQQDTEVALFVGDNEIGVPSPGALQELSTRVGFPSDFVRKLSPSLQAAVLNERIQRYAEEKNNTEFTFVHRLRQISRDGGMIDDPGGRNFISNIAPGSRGIVQPADVAQTAYNLLADVYGHDGVTIKLATPNENDMRLRIATVYNDEIRPGGRSVGDVMSLGIDIRYQAGINLEVSLYIERLVCLNGMIASQQAFDWKQRSIGGPEHQLQWITIGIANAIGEFDNIIQKAREMAATKIEGDPRRALIERARAIKIPPRFDERLIMAFDQEEGDSEYDMLNAFTRLATHGGIPMANSDSLMLAAGNWTANFDMVSARIPRPMAMHIGAHIEEA